MCKKIIGKNVFLETKQAFIITQRPAIEMEDSCLNQWAIGLGWPVQWKYVLN